MESIDKRIGSSTVLEYYGIKSILCLLDPAIIPNIMIPVKNKLLLQALDNESESLFKYF